MKRIIPWIIFLLLPLQLSGQQYGFRSFSLEEGLPQTEILGLIQDSKGFIWAGTNGGGLVRFNGRSFRVITTKDGLPDNIIYSLGEDLDGNLWIGSMNAISRYDGVEFRTFHEENTPGFRAYNQVFADSSNRIWAVSFDDRNFLRLVRVREDRIEAVSDEFEELSGNILNVFHSPHSGILVSTLDALYLLEDRHTLRPSPLNEYKELKGRIIIPQSIDRQGGLILSSFDQDRVTQYFHMYRNGILTGLEVPEDPWFSTVNTVYSDSRDRLWFGNFGNGIAMYDPEEDRYYFYRQQNGLGSDFIIGFTEDHEGNIWMGSRGSGLIKYSHNSFVSFDFENSADGNMVREIYEDSRGNLWFGLAAAGLVKYDGTSFVAYSKNRFPGIENTRGITEITPGLFLLASVNGLFHFDGRFARNVNDLYELPDNLAYVDLHHDGDTLWLTTLNAGIVRIINGRSAVYTVQSGHLQSNFFNGIYKDSHGNMWFCSNNGIGKYRDGAFSWYTAEDGLSYPITLQITEDMLGRIWIATYMEGINIFDGENFQHLGKEDGLSSDIIYSIISDSRGDIWAGTNNGVSRILLDSTGNILKIRNYGKYDGFTGIENNGTAIFIDSQDHLWFGTVKGAMRYDPHESSPNPIPPQVHITGVNLFFRDIDWSSDAYSGYYSELIPWFRLPGALVFPHDSNHLTFEFEALSFQVPEKVRYKWKLEGLDKEWSPVSDLTEVVYANIPPGEYNFQVLGMNNDGVWSEEPASFVFLIRPPWWETWYFVVFIILAMAGIISLAMRWRIRRIEAKRRELETMVEEKTREVLEQNRQLASQKEEITAQAERLQVSYTNLENLSEIGKTITSQLSVENIIETVYESINKLMDATVFGIGIVNRDNNSIDFPGVKEKGETLDFLSFSLDDELRLSSYCVKTGNEVFINDFDKEYKKFIPAITPPIDNTGNSASILYLPLIVNEKTTGVITVQSFEKNAYTDYHLNILRNLAVYTTIALENASAYRKIKLQSDDLKKANADISSQKQRIEQTNKELVDLNNEKNHLIGIVAHDLRNPLTSSLAIAQNLQSEGGKGDEMEKESIGFLVNALHRMNEMVSKILDIRMIEQKKINMKCEEADLGEIIQDVYQNMKETAENKNITLKIESRKVFGLVDRHYLTQVFENLLSNSIKFSPKNSEVLIRVVENNGEARVNFIDSGPGIREDEMDKLFGKYQKLSARPTAGENSTGLGLSIVKKYVDVMGGKVWCESDPGKGSNFIVSFRKIK